MQYSWLNKSLYPFESKFLQIENSRMHYIDEGEGETIVFVHGTPSWSFEYRHLIQHFKSRYRCIAADHIGFGLSDKAKNIDYSVEKQAERFSAFMKNMELKKIHLVIHDFGGPIALNYAVNNPEKILSLTILNSFCWDIKRDKGMTMGAKMFDNKIGEWLYLNANFSVNFMLKNSWGDKSRLDAETFKHYQKPFEEKESRYSTVGLLKSLLGAANFYENIYSKLNRLEEIPHQAIWGMKDKFFPSEKILPLWKAKLKYLKISELNNSAHFPQETEPEAVIDAISRLIEK